MEENNLYLHADIEINKSYEIVIFTSNHKEW